MKKASKSSPNKSQLVREFASKNPTATVADIVKHFASMGTSISLPLAYQALKTKAKTGAKRGRKPGSSKTAVSAAAASSASVLESALEYIKKTGSIDRAIETLAQLKKIG